MSNWSTIRLRRLLDGPAVGGTWGTDPGDGEIDVRCVRGTDFDQTRLVVNQERLPTRSVTLRDYASRGLRQGDLVLEKSGGGEQQPVGRCVLFTLDLPCVPTNFACRLRAAPTASERFLAYLLSSLYSLGITRRAIKQTTGIQNLDTEAFLRELVRVPDKAVQERIADFLDAETAQIDAIIDRKRRMIELLRVQHDGLIRDAVTGRLTLGRKGAQDAPDRRSKTLLPWAVDTPGRWDMRPVGSVLQLRNESNSPIRTEQVLSLTADRGVIPYEEKGDIGNKASEDISRYHLVYPGDIVLNSMNVIIGSVGLSKHFGALSPVYYVLRQRDPASTDIRYLAYHFRIREFQKQLARLGYGILDHRLRIPWINLKREAICVPPLSEQVAIADLLDVETRRADSMVKALSSSVDLLTERRQALITGAVTGQLDCAEVA